ncbi:hypothetical protein AYI70_g2239 [Smittium culicis]|uniref:Uncharacterized protein n=1 Tax=Smittium culicis TaxID=133412 RepID=A0A1R1XNP9_9FUNG|nr:hypothetical protein AYI70_g6748 [Smittium culicis]OMJ23479.1 hypothetical protein AYI70_g2239 [Smittium culicis]
MEKSRPSSSIKIKKYSSDSDIEDFDYLKDSAETLTSIGSQENPDNDNSSLYTEYVDSDNDPKLPEDISEFSSNEILVIRNNTENSNKTASKDENKLIETSKENSLISSPFIYIMHFFKAFNFKGILVISLTTIGLPFISGMMVGLGEIFANELMFYYGWRGATPIRIIGTLSRAKKL